MEFIKAVKKSGFKRDSVCGPATSPASRSTTLAI